MLIRHRYMVLAALAVVSFSFLTSTVLLVCLFNVDVGPFAEASMEEKKYLFSLVKLLPNEAHHKLEAPRRDRMRGETEPIGSRELASLHGPIHILTQLHSSDHDRSNALEGEGRPKSFRGSQKTLSSRERFDEKFPPLDLVRVRGKVESLRSPRPVTQLHMPYNVFDCPHHPPEGYPMSWPLVDNILKDWNADETDIPSSIYQGLCVFDWENDQKKAETYRESEVPFILVNHPEVLRTTERWNHPNYLREMIGPKPQRIDHSKSSHFMFWRVARGIEVPDHWEAPTDEVQLSFDEWYQRAQELQSSSADHRDIDHWYLRLNANFRGVNSYIYEELPIFEPLEETSFFNVDPKMHPGVNCRGGSKGAVAENHFDTFRNFVALFSGRRRYILSAPSECRNLELFPDGHPSARHSRLDWSHPPGANYTGPFRNAMSSEVVLQPGDVLYIPDLWFHFIVSLDINIQCNARSGRYTGYDHNIQSCGFPMS